MMRRSNRIAGCADLRTASGPIVKKTAFEITVKAEDTVDDLKTISSVSEQ